MDPASLRGQENRKGADLVMEVVSGDPQDRDRDYVRKRRDYARAGIQEYSIVAPDAESIIVLVLDGKRYRLHGRFRRGQTADSQTLSGFGLDVDKVMEQGM